MANNKDKSKKRLRSPRPVGALSRDTLPLQESMRSGSDLSCALIGGAAMENMLMYVLERFLVDCEESKDLFDIKGDLDSITKCKRMAFCLGLIDRLSYKNIGMVARIRNKFAHNHEPIDFKNEEIVGMCNDLELNDPTGKEFGHLNAREKFCTVVSGEWERMFINGISTERRVELGKS